MLLETFGDKDLPLQDPFDSTYLDKSSKLPRNFGVVVPNKLFRSGIPTFEQIDEMSDRYGIEHIVSLIGGQWIGKDRLRDKFGITQHTFDILQRRALTKEVAKRIVTYIGTLHGPVLVHCLKGSIRTGHIIAGHRIWNEGTSPVSAIIEAMPYGMVNLSSIREISRY